MRSKSQKPPKSNIYATITEKLLAAIEDNPGDPVLPVNAVTGQAYRGVNVLILWISALERGYDSGEWATLRQWNEKGAHVRKGEKASPIVFYKELAAATEPDAEQGDTETERRRVARGYWVFAAEQVDGYQPATTLPSNPVARVVAAEAYFAATGVNIIIGGTQACYRPSTVTIHMPDEARFIESDGRTRTESWYAVLGHETTHWAGAPHRLDRAFGKRFGMTPIASKRPAPRSVRLSCAHASASRWSRIPITPATSTTGSRS